MVGLVGFVVDLHSDAELGEPGWELVIQGDRQDLSRLGRSDDPRATEVLNRFLEQGDTEERIHAVEALERLRAIEALIVALADRDRLVRGRAARALRTLGFNDDRSLERIVQAGSRARLPTKIELIKILGRIGREELVEPCIRALGNEAWEVRAVAAEALGRLGDPSALGPLSRARVDSQSEVWVRAREALRELGLEPRLEPLVEALRHEDWNVRLTAIDALAVHSSPSALEALGRAVHDAQPGVGAHALQRLIEQGDGAAYEVLSAQMQVGEIEVRGRIARELAAKVSRPALDALVGGIKGGTLSDASRLAAEPLFPLGATWIIERLVRALSDEDARVRRFATQVLSDMKNASSAPLVAALVVDDTGLRDLLVRLLEKRNDAETSRKLIGLLANDDKDVRRRASELLVNMGHRGVSALIAAMSGEDERIVVRSALLLADVGDWRSLKALERAANDPSPVIRGAAQAALVAMKR